MNMDIFRNMSYGVYIVSTMDGERPTGCTANSIMQITSSPATVAVSINHDNYTNSCIEKTGKFAFSILAENSDPALIGCFGFRSGRDVDKIKDLGLELEEPLNISVPGIRQLPLTLECRVIYKQEQPLEGLPDDVITRYYPEGDKHTAYYGQIVGAYQITS